MEIFKIEANNIKNYNNNYIHNIYTHIIYIGIYIYKIR